MKKIKINCPWYIILVIIGVFAFSAVCWFNFIKGFKSQTDSADKSVIEKVDECVDNIDTKWSDSIFQKKILSRVDSIYTYYSTKEISSSQVFKGKEKWLFYKSVADGDPMGEYEGKKVFTDDEMKTTLDSCIKTQNKLDERGIKSLIFVCPNKENVYTDYIPETYKHVEESRTDKLLKFLGENGVNVVNPKKEIISNSKENQLYYWYDTHWNQLGGYLGVKSILDKWNIEIAPLSERKINTKRLSSGYHISGEDDLAKMVGLREIAFNDDIEYSVDGTKEIDWNLLQ